MPRKNKGVRTLLKTDDKILKKAVLDVLENEMSIRGAAKKYKLCHMTLKRYINKYKNSESPQSVKFEPNYKINQIFSKELEDQLESYLITASKIHHGLTRKDTLGLAYQLAVSKFLKQLKFVYLEFLCFRFAMA